MKLYKIRISDSDIYIKCIIIGLNGIKAVPSIDEEEAAIYEEDKANAYMNMLNEENKGKIIFELEECGEI